MVKWGIPEKILQNADALTLCHMDPLAKSYDQILFYKISKKNCKIRRKKVFLEHPTAHFKKQSILPEFDKDEKLKKEAVWKLSFLKLRSDISSLVVW